MKPKNFPGRKIERQLVAKHGAFAFVDKPELNKLVQDAMSIKTKKRRTAR